MAAQVNERPITVGDLVQVVRGHSCILARVGGWTFVVVEIVQPRGGGWYCEHCKTENAGPNEPGAARRIGEGAYLPLSWLKRIPPLAELEGQRTEESIREPA